MMQRKAHRESSEILELLRAYYESGMSKRAFCQSHSLCGSALLNKWIKKYSVAEESVSLAFEPDTQKKEAVKMEEVTERDYRKENAELRREIRKLEKALEFSRLETRVRDMMIDRAEEYYRVPIRKKSGAR